MTPRKHVPIDNQGNAPDVTLSIGAHDQLLWVSSGKKFRVTFTGRSPFAEQEYDIPAGGALDPGPVVNKPSQPIDPTNPHKSFYTIHNYGSAGGLDPAVIITD